MPRSRKEWDEELAAGMLEDLEELTGVSIGEMMADEIEEPEFETFRVYEEPTEDEPLDLDNPDGDTTDNYFDELFDHIDVSPDEEDSYGDEGN